MNVLSLFDGISCGHVALIRGRYSVDSYFASEIDENASRYTYYEQEVKQILQITVRRSHKGDDRLCQMKP